MQNTSLPPQSSQSIHPHQSDQLKLLQRLNVRYHDFLQNKRLRIVGRMLGRKSSAMNWRSTLSRLQIRVNVVDSSKLLFDVGFCNVVTYVIVRWINIVVWCLEIRNGTILLIKCVRCDSLASVGGSPEQKLHNGLRHLFLGCLSGLCQYHRFWPTSFAMIVPLSSISKSSAMSGSSSCCRFTAILFKHFNIVDIRLIRCKCLFWAWACPAGISLDTGICQGSVSAAVLWCLAGTLGFA